MNHSYPLIPQKYPMNHSYPYPSINPIPTLGALGAGVMGRPVPPGKIRQNLYVERLGLLVPRRKVDGPLVFVANIERNG